jgi:RNA polymerase sigma-70 factor (ECF subfamily)
MKTHSDIFLEHRGLLFSMAYNMLGDVDDAEDIVQETFLNWLEVSAGPILHPKAYLVKMVTNRCINYLNSAKVRREQYIGVWLPEPLLESSLDVEFSKADSYQALSIGILLLLEKLSPRERAIFLLREIFSYEYFELAEIFEKTEESCRQILKRAKENLGKDIKRFKVDIKSHEKMLRNFLQACAQGAMDELIGLLKEDIVLFADGGGRSISVNGQRLTAALKPILGSENVGRFLITVFSKISQFMEDFSREMVITNGLPAIISYTGDTPLSLVSFECDGDKILNVFIQTNPDKLKQFSKSPSI